MAAPRKPRTSGVRKKKTAAVEVNGVANGSPPQAAPAPVDAPPINHGGNGLVFTAIQQRAYELFVQRGAEHGHDLSDWLTAEQELKQKLAAHV
jgi:Protein of unknown function (DUF2934)